MLTGAMFQVFTMLHTDSAMLHKAWPSSRSSVPAEIADAKEEACAMCTVPDNTD